MNRFVINRPVDFDDAVKVAVRRAFPFASPSPTTLNATEREYRGAAETATSRIEGSRKERFSWGSSLIGGSHLVG